MGKDKIAFLDRDGVINVDYGYVFEVEKFEFISGVVKALRLLLENGYKIVIVTNQSGIARGFYSLEDFKRVNFHMLDLFDEEGISILDVMFCQHHKDGVVEGISFECDCRKPKTGMFERAVLRNNLNLDYKKSFMVGDKESDVLAGRSFGVRSFLVERNKKEELLRVVCDEILHLK